MFTDTRIKGNMSIMDTLVIMSEGNPGAVTCLADVMKETTAIDPQNLMGGLNVVLSLDTYGIYGSPIYILWADQCNRDTREFLMLMRATQLGFLSSHKLREISDDQTGRCRLTSEEMTALNDQVMIELEDFQPRKEA